MDDKRQKLLESFFSCALKHKNSMRYARTEKNKIKRAFYGFKEFGFSYILYNLCRFKVPGLLGNTSGKLFFGRKMIWPAGDIGANVLSMYGIHPHKSEKRLALWIINNLNNFEVFYDIGAHLGYYAALSVEMAPEGEIHAFEANKKLCGYLNRNFSGSKNVHISCAAVAESVGEVDFYDATKTEDSSASSRFNLSELDIAPSRIAATTLDEYIKRGNKAPTTIKIDVEGGEYDVVMGGLNLIKEYKPRIIMEVWAGEMGRKYSDKAVKKLQELGYKAFLLKNGGDVSVEPVNDPVGSILDCSNGARDNFLFLMK